MIFLTEQWLLVSLMCVLVYIYLWREKSKAGASLSVHQVTALVNKGESVLVDIRDAAEFKVGHIVDAINIPHNKVEKQLADFAKFQGKTIILVDKMGQHTGNAGRLLRAQGYDVVRLDGGIADWQGQNLPLVK
ncbi:rhodanese-like domain-containing protein [Simiduia curdlanivorans]|nr:rhodanese-like domain-containing protein [Simiduia curdlanivorans]MDN3637411.1 rhodanese-like domain-containing protein [Simiduia curdlanivorans]